MAHEHPESTQESEAGESHYCPVALAADECGRDDERFSRHGKERGRDCEARVVGELEAQSNGAITESVMKWYLTVPFSTHAGPGAIFAHAAAA